MAKGPYDDIVRKVLERLGANAPKTAAKTTKSVGRKAVSVPAKGLTKAERSAANRAKSAADRAKYDAKLAAERPAEKAARTAENKAKGVARGNRKAEEAYGYRTELKNNTAKAWFEKEVDKISRTIDQSERISVRGSQGRKDALRKQINKLDEYAKKEGYELKLSDKKQIIKGVLDDAKRAGEWGNIRLKQVIGQTGGKTTKEMVDMGARRARSQEIKTGKILTGKKPVALTANQQDTQRRLTRLYEKQQQDKLIKKADSKMGNSTGPRKKVYKPVVETKSSKRLRELRAKNAKKSVVDPKVAKMTKAEYKKFLATENKRWKNLKDVKVSGRGYTDAEAKAKLAALGERELGSSARLRAKKPKPSPEGLRKQFSKK